MNREREEERQPGQDLDVFPTHKRNKKQNEDTESEDSTVSPLVHARQALARVGTNDTTVPDYPASIPHHWMHNGGGDNDKEDGDCKNKC